MDQCIAWILEGVNGDLPCNTNVTLRLDFASQKKGARQEKMTIILLHIN
jgi:hypothetical protein